MSSGPGLIFAPRTTETLEISTGTGKQESNWSPKVVWIITIIILIIIIVIGILLIATTGPQEIIELRADENIYNLDELANVQDALCCVRPGEVIPTARWLYDATLDYTISLDKTNCDVVCQGLMGSNLTDCMNFCQGEDGNPKPVAHKGISLYYAYAPGNTITTCDSFSPCP